MFHFYKNCVFRILISLFIIALVFIAQGQSTIKDIENLETYGLGQLYGATFSPEGNSLISYGGRGIIVRDVKTGEVQEIIESQRLIEDNKYGRASYLSPDNQYLATFSSNDEISIYNIETGNLVNSWKGQASFLTYSPSGLLIAGGSPSSADYSIKVWDSTNGNLIQTFKEHDGFTSAISISPDGNHIASASSNVGDYSIKVWSIQTGRLIFTLGGHTNYVSRIIYSKDGSYIASGSSDHSVKIWNAKTGNIIHTFDAHSSRISSLSFSPNGTSLATGSDSDRFINIWDLNTGKLIKSLDVHHTTGIRSLNYSPDGQRLVSTSGVSDINVWNVSEMKMGTLIAVLEDHTGAVESVNYSHDSNYLVSALRNIYLEVWDTQSNDRVFKRRRHYSSVNTAIYSPNNNYIASGAADNNIIIRNANDSKIVHKLTGHSDTVNSVSYSSNGHYLASGSRDSTVKIWDTNTGNLIHTLEGHNSSVNSVNYSLDNNLLASGSSDKVVNIWDINTGNLIHTLEGHDSAVISVNFSPNGYNLASGSVNGTIKIWDINSGNLISNINAHLGLMTSIAYSPDGYYIASAKDFSHASQVAYDNDAPIKLWETKTNTLIHSLAANSVSINSLAFSPDGRYLAFGSNDGTINTWGLANGDVVFCAGFCDDFQQLVTPPSIFIHSPTAGSAISQASVSIDLRLDDGGETPEFDVRIANQQLAVITSKGLQATQDGSDRVSLDVVLPEQYRGQNISLSVEARNSAGFTSQDVSFTFAARQTIPEKRVALVFGNSQYENSIDLTNPINDANSISNLLSNLDFEVFKYTDVSSSEMRRAVRDFELKSEDADISLVYYSGHGVQIDGFNYLVPVNDDFNDSFELQENAYKVDLLVNKLSATGSDVNIVILDACRDNPYKGFKSSAEKGLAATATPASQFLIAYATNSGNVALDGNGNNSPYVEAMLQHFPEPNVSIEEALRNVRRSVREATGGDQIPTYNGGLEEEVCLAGCQ